MNIPRLVEIFEFKFKHRDTITIDDCKYEYLVTLEPSFYHLDIFQRSNHNHCFCVYLIFRKKIFGIFPFSTKQKIGVSRLSDWDDYSIPKLSYEAIDFAKQTIETYHKDKLQILAEEKLMQ